MKNADLLNKREWVANIPLVFEGRELSSKLQAKLMLMRVTLDKGVNALNEKMQEVVKGLKPEGFDDLAREKYAMDETESKLKAYNDWNGEGEQPVKPTDEEIAKAKAFREEKLEDYNSKEADVKKKLAEADKQEMEEESDVKIKSLTEEEFAQIIDVIKTEGEIDVVYQGQQGKMTRVSLLATIAATLVEA